MSSDSYQSVLSFWFGELDGEGCATPDKVKQWWKKDPAFDSLCRERFGDLHRAITSKERESWRSTAKGCLGYIIVLDQLSRNMFRDTRGMFAADPQTQDAVCVALEEGLDKELRLHERVFFYMPLMHAEDLNLQKKCIECFKGFRDELSGELRKKIEGNLDYARQHRDVIARFGRFPHRNQVLGRESTAEEAEFLTQPGSSF